MKCARVALGDQPRQRRLAGAGRAPEDDRLQPVLLDRPAQRPPGRDAARPGRRTRRACAAACARRAARDGPACRRRGRSSSNSGSVSEDGHQARRADARLRSRSAPRRSRRSAIRPAGASGWSAARRRSTSLGGRPGPSPPSRIATGRRRSHAGSGVPSRGTVATSRSLLPRATRSAPAATAAPRPAAGTCCPSRRAAPSSRTDPRCRSVTMSRWRRRPRRRGRSRRRCPDPGRRSISTSGGLRPRACVERRRPAAARWRRRRRCAPGSSRRAPGRSTWTTRAPACRRRAAPVRRQHRSPLRRRPPRLDWTRAAAPPGAGARRRAAALARRRPRELAEVARTSGSGGSRCAPVAGGRL